MALLLRGGDYVPDEMGGLRTVEGAEEVLQRVLFQLQARRGSFPFLPELGSRLYRLCPFPPPGAAGRVLSRGCFFLPCPTARAGRMLGCPLPPPAFPALLEAADITPADLPQRAVSRETERAAWRPFHA